MHAVIGVWELDPSAQAAQEAALTHIVEGVSHLPGIVKGYWADAEDTGRSHTVIVFEERDQAASFADSVRANLQGQLEHGVHNLSLDIVAVKATT